MRTTPLLKSDTLSELIRGEVLIKAESLQITGAFKFRGAFYRLLNLTDCQKVQGVIAYSSGNFAAGLSAAGQLLDIPVKLVMPHDAPKSKIHNARHYGAEVILCHGKEPSREEAASDFARKIAHDHGAVLLHPFDDNEIIIGQASVALELQEQLAMTGKTCDHILCPVGGGSLVAGSSLVFDSSTQVWAVEVDGYQGMGISLEKGRRSRAKGHVLCDCDALLSLEPGIANLDIVLQTGVRGITVNAQQAHDAVRLSFHEMNLVLEPSGAVAIAAIMKNPALFENKTVVAIGSGGNVDAEKYASILQAT
ncbi:threonine/serine dehydratase [Endozoicomonas sp. SCSIO W0465]|uniref:threonine ammonia-lyase n=1 Tax=Endozoicomonas sp. SCSIO W0465 TaxID=2918516 RepID=UPI002074C618|nr:threonine/serine dehydratase [Endozoicomonas sp. SCSIO W0465]USE33784.1 threonine/serine dehydratase [Endozoicomonas sp. SCSIO W0465]